MLKKIALLFLLVPFAASAQVSLKNGNFFIGYVDMNYSGGLEPKIERVYNSKSSYNGIFGFGWGSNIETYLVIAPDGSIVIHEEGSGAQNRFAPPNAKAANIDAAIAKILAAKKNSGAGLSGTLEKEELAKLKADASYRNEEWFRLARAGLVKAEPVPVGVVFKSNKFSYQTVTKTKDTNGKDTYTRRYDNGRVETFDGTGHLVRISDKNKNFINFGYDRSNRLVSIQDNLNRKMAIIYNKDGKVESVTSESNKKAATYTHNGVELTGSKDTDGNVYGYKYSDNGRHNIVQITFPDKSTMGLGYYDVKQGETVKWVKDQNGAVTEYGYGGDSINGFDYFTTTAVKNPEGKLISKAKYEYFEKLKSDGERFTYKVNTDIDGDKTETIYNECCGLPLVITQNGKKTTFEYDTFGHVTKKISPTEVTQLEYDNSIGKVSRVTKIPKEGGAKPQWAAYNYDKAGNLIGAKNSAGQGARIVYDFNGRIKALVDQDSRTLEFTYNEASRPVEIKDKSIGSIRVQYTPAGEVSKVDSTGGRKIAAQVTSAFQNLLELIGPAGVKLTP